MPCSLSRRNTWHTWLVGKGAGVAANVDLMMGSLLSGKITSINKEYSICPVFCSKANHLKSQELVPSNSKLNFEFVSICIRVTRIGFGGPTYIRLYSK